MGRVQSQAPHVPCQRERRSELSFPRTTGRLRCYAEDSGLYAGTALSPDKETEAERAMML